MNKLLLLLSLVIVISLASCKDKKKNSSVTESALVNTELSQKAMEDDSQNQKVDKITVDSTKSVIKLFKNAEKNIGKLVIVQGEVSHVCAHTGLRLFLKSADGKLTLKVTTGGDIKIFNQDLVGKFIEIEGTLVEKKLSAEEINEFEKKVESKNEEEGHCSTEKENIEKMRTWMKEHNKNYYSIYSVKAKSYKVLGE